MRSPRRRGIRPRQAPPRCRRRDSSLASGESSLSRSAMILSGSGSPSMTRARLNRSTAAGCLGSRAARSSAMNRASRGWPAARYASASNACASRTWASDPPSKQTSTSLSRAGTWPGTRVTKSWRLETASAKSSLAIAVLVAASMHWNAASPARSARRTPRSSTCSRRSGACRSRRVTALRAPLSLPVSNSASARQSSRSGVSAPAVTVRARSGAPASISPRATSSRSASFDGSQSSARWSAGSASRGSRAAMRSCRSAAPRRSPLCMRCSATAAKQLAASPRRPSASEMSASRSNAGSRPGTTFRIFR